MCQSPCVFGQVGLLPDQQDETFFAVTWDCPKCGPGAVLDVCPVGPLVPRKGDCLNCGHTLPPGPPEQRSGLRMSI